MSRRNREFNSRVKSRRPRARLRAQLNAPRDRRGVLLLVVLSLLVLFMLIGTAFLMSSNQYKTAATASAKNNRLGNFPTKLLDRALMQVLCDTGNPYSVIRYHSLLRDFYGAEGFEAIVYSPLDTNLNPSFANPINQLTRYSTQPTGPYGAAPNKPENPTQGQLIDIYVRELAYKADDPLTPAPVNEAAAPYALSAPDARHILKLERSAIGLPEMYDMPLTKGYFNGCLLTITSGPAAGQSTRIVDYELVGNMDPAITNPPATLTAPFPPKLQTRLFRLRVMAFPTSDGGPLLTREQFPQTDDRRSTHDARRLEIADLANATFIVNGRPFSGTGTGFNELAKAGEPRLNAAETVGITTNQDYWLYPEMSLTPNAAFSFVADPTNSASDLWGARYLSLDNAGNPVYLPLNPTDPNVVGVPPVSAINLRPLLWKYPTFTGPGDADESYDAADFQNVALALQTVTPRARGRIVQGNDPTQPATLEVDDPAVNATNFLRLDLEDLPIPSYHRPDLENYWFHRLALFAANPDRTSPPTVPIGDDHVRAVLTPYGADGIRDNGDDPTGVDLDIRDQIVAMKRKISLRPIREDHPGFDGSNPASRPIDLENSNPLVRNGNIAIPFFEATGPWDVDNDNDGVPDSVWVDLGEPVQQAEDGTLYKPLYAFLIVDLDSRLNVNAHGLVDHLRAPQLDANLQAGGPGNLAHDIALTLAGIPSLRTSNLLPSGSGYGPAEISLRPLFSPNLPGNADITLRARVGNPAYDDYSRILSGRPALGQQPSVWGRHGSVNIRGDATIDWNDNLLATRQAIKVRPGIEYDVTDALTQAATLDKLTMFKFFGYPLWLSNYFGAIPTASSFSQAPDLLGRYAIGLDYTGQPASEPYGDSLYTIASGDPDLSLLFDTPYELDLSDSRRRETPDAAVASAISASKTAALNDDAPFATAELEHILRAHDADSGILPDRLWNLVDAFDPLKLLDNQPQLVDGAALTSFGNTGGDERFAAAQQLAAVNRRLVTTDSYDVPVPTGNFLKRLIYGADGLPGEATVDDDGNGVFDDPVELGWYNTDDWYAVMYHQPLPLPPPAQANFNTNGSPKPLAGIRLEPQNPTIVDLLRYRVQFERRKRGVPLYSEAELTLVTQQLLAPELLAGQKMDLNRPFGDGRDNGDGLDNDGLNGIDDSGEFTNYAVGAPERDPFMDGIVDDPLEAGEPFVDSLTGPNHNGKRDLGERFYNFIGGAGELTSNDTDYNGPRDTLWQGLTGEPIGFSHNHGGVTTDGRLTDLNDDDDVDDVGEGRFRYNGIIQRQTYARQLYSLMMLLVDENYIASQNVAANAEGNINLQFFFRELWSQIAYELAEERGRAPAAPDMVPTPIQQDYTDAQPIAERLALRKLTARRIAQWAINAVDFRDTDAEMTPFEYDDNPFDGWGLYVPDIANPNDPPLFVPIDGDPGTNENWGGVKPFKVYPTKFDRTAASHSTNNPQEDANADNATRGIVWGAERPELLITETLAFHDRRCTDEPEFGNLGQPANPGPTSATNPPDYDLDQRLKPRGSLFFELYNPNSEDGPRPADLYGKDAAENNQAQGVMVNRLSNYGVNTAVGAKRSPVWRVAVVQDPLNGRLTNQIIDISTLTAPAGAEDREALASQFLTTDASGFGFDSDRDAERLIYFTSGRDYTTGLGSDVSRDNDEDLQVEYQDLLNRVANPDNPNIAVWIPPLPYRELTQVPTGYNAFVTSSPYVPTARRYFIARNQRRLFGDPTPAQDAAIAPILPGRYAVVGSSGLQYDANGTVGPASLTTTRYVTPMSRWLQVATGGDPEQTDADHVNPAAILETRRFELWPSTNPDNNSPAQFLIGENGGPEIVSQNGSLVNVTDVNLDGVPDSTLVDPAVTIPVEDMNISEPVEGYPTARYVLMYQDTTINPNPSSLPLSPQRADLNGDGELAYPTPYNRPLDMEDVLLRNGTTQNYRSLHLQRLANPMFPWNPPAFDDRGVANAMHRPNLPVNPYLTVDSQSADLTACNGASQLERTDLPFQGAPPPRPNATPTEDLLQGDYFAPLSAGEYLQAPDHVLAGLIAELAKENLIDLWRSVESVRGTGSPADEANLRALLNDLEQLREGNTISRGSLVDDVTEWGWHRLRRVMPDDSGVAPPGTYNELEFIQRLNFKSLERGAHHQSYYKYPQPGSPEGWWFDTRWEPRLIWKQERPNTMLFLRNPGSPTVRVTDMKNVPSRRMIMQRSADMPRTEDHFTQDDDQRNGYLVNTHQLRQHVIDFVCEQTLGFVNESYAPDLDRNGGNDKSAMLTAITSDPMPGAPEIASDPSSLIAPEANEVNRWNTVGTQEQQVLIQPAEELQRRQRLMKSTFPWFTWNNRPFTSADELTQVPASSPSLMLREYSVASRNTANPYDGDGMADATPAQLETVNDRLARQQGAFGQLLNFFQAADKPAGTYATTPGGPLEPLSGGPNYYRLLDFVEVPSRYVGTDTLLSPEVFNDNPLLSNAVEDITALDDPRLLLQPPFNKVSRQRDPGRVNLNTVTGRRVAGDESSLIPAHIWSEVYDGVMHRYQDGNLLDPTVVAPNPASALQLGHFGPAWRDVALSRRGYSQFNADSGANSVDKLSTMPDTLSFGLNNNFPSVFSNPFRSADAGDLVPLAIMVRPGVEASFTRSHHYARARDSSLETTPFAHSGTVNTNINWGVADYDDDRNGIVDDIREAGFGDNNATDGDRLRLNETTKALTGSGIPLFSEEVPEPAIDAERNPGMMYQPMTRLGNLVTTRSNVYAIWVTVGYFEVERAPDWNLLEVRQKFGGDNSLTSDRSIRGRALYDRVYPDGYTLGEELGTDTGDTNRERAFYIIDRTEPVGFKPGEELNADKMIRVRRRIE